MSAFNTTETNNNIIHNTDINETNSVQTINTTEPTLASSLILKDSLISYMKWAMIELSCNNSIDHRDYDREDKPEPRLKQIIEENNYDFNLAFCKMAEELISNKNNKLYKLFKNLVSSYSIDDDDSIYDDKQELVCYVNNFIGLYEIKTLHPDDCDKFEDKLLMFLGIYNENGEPNEDLFLDLKENEIEIKSASYEESELNVESDDE